MKSNNTPLTLSRRLRHNHRGLMEGVRRLTEDLARLRYEGKPSFGKNLKKTRASLALFLKHFQSDTDLEEKVVFPFLKKHVPKLSFMLQILEEEHGDLRRNVALLERLTRQLGKKSAAQGSPVVDRLIQKGNYVHYFLRNHSSAENECVYRVLDSELSPAEKASLGRFGSGK